MSPGREKLWVNADGNWDTVFNTEEEAEATRSASNSVALTRTKMWAKASEREPLKPKGRLQGQRNTVLPSLLSPNHRVGLVGRRL